MLTHFVHYYLRKLRHRKVLVTQPSESVRIRPQPGLSAELPAAQTVPRWQTKS